VKAEDLGDETLAQISTPTRTRGAPSLVSAHGGRTAQPQSTQMAHAATQPSRVRSQRSTDDSDAVLRRASATSAKQQQASSAACVPESAEEEDGATRRMFDKRELRKRHKGVFDQQLSAWRSQYMHKSPPASTLDTARVRVCVRKRPLFEHERGADEFDVISVRGGTELVIHNCLTKPDLRSLFVSHMGFQFAHVFGDATQDDEVYTHCSAPAVQHVLRGGVATLFMFGQTGSGKTHTMEGLIRRAAHHLYHGGGWEERGPPDDSPVTLVAFEIAGKTMRDLLDRSGKELKVMEDRDRCTHVMGVSSQRVASPEELLELIWSAQAHRATRATQVNDTSSRSHAVYRIYRGGEGPGNPVLTMVDCAGSERREDSTHHDAQTRKDAAEINSTIFALKECFRVMRSSKGQQPPYRESLLTRVLSDSFSSDQALIVAIGTVSPSATDTEHSMGTLRALQQLQGTQMSFEHREDIAKPKSAELPHPRTWSEDDVRQWVETALAGRARHYAMALKKGTDGKNITRWPVQRFVMLCGGDDDLGTRLYQDLRQQQQSAGRGVS